MDRLAVPPAPSDVTARPAWSNGVKALTFDVFGTVVDWRSSIIRDGQLLGAAAGLSIDWARFADRWREGYAPAMNRVRQGELPWTTLDHLHRMILDALLEEFGILALTEEQKRDFNRVWHRLDPWPDAVAGLLRLKRHYLITSLSNGNLSLLANLAKYVGLPWDVVLSAELFRHYKPDPEVYLGAASLLDLPPSQILMVAAHPSDLRAARAVGLKTAYILRPAEYGPNRPIDTAADNEFDLVAGDFLELAAKLGA